jgi:V-type H+-transporting ATPase subunit a
LDFDTCPLQVKLEGLERELLEVNGNAERLARSFSELVELQLVLEKASSFFDDAQARASTSAFEARPTESARAAPPMPLPALPHVLRVLPAWACTTPRACMHCSGVYDPNG